MMLHMIVGQLPGWLQVWREVELAVKPRMVVLQTRRSVRAVRRVSTGQHLRVVSMANMSSRVSTCYFSPSFLSSFAVVFVNASFSARYRIFSCPEFLGSCHISRSQACRFGWRFSRTGETCL